MYRDEDGSYSFGARVTWLQSERGMTEHDACVKVNNEFPEIGGFCDPDQCNSLFY